MPGGVAKTFIPTKETELKSAFDEWLARVVCFAFSISPQPFTDHVNRATAETAQAAALAEGLAPIQNWVKQLVDYLLITEFDAPDLEFAWRDEREIDAQKLAGITQIYVTHGIKTVNEARAEIGLDPVEGGDTPMVFTGTGAVPLAQAARGGDAGGAEAAAKALAKYSPDQPRDERGRWASGDDAASTAAAMQVAQAEPAVTSDGDRPLMPVAGSEESESSRGRGFIEDEFLDPAAPVRQFQYQQSIARLRAIDPANPEATTFQTRNFVPKPEDVQRVQEAEEAALNEASGKIAAHSYEKHAVNQQEFPEIRGEQELRQLVQDVIRNSPPEQIARGRSIFYDEKTNTLVLINPRGESTVFRPRNGAAYVQGLRDEK